MGHTFAEGNMGGPEPVVELSWLTMRETPLGEQLGEGGVSKHRA